MSTKAISYVLVGLILGALTINFLFTEAPETAPTQLTGGVTVANPASVFCIENGGSLSMDTTAEGTAGTCTFPTGEQCEEWALFRGECDIAQVSKRVSYTDGTTITRAVFRLKNNTVIVTAPSIALENELFIPAVSASGARYETADRRVEFWEDFQWKNN
jgi:uncharacterized protein